MQIELQRFLGNDEMHDTGALVALIIESMQKDGHVELITKEPISAVDIGFRDILDSLCNHFKWNKSDITLVYQNFNEPFSNEMCGYNVRPAFEHTQWQWRKSVFAGKFENPLPWNGEYLFGMFIGRLNVTRLRAIENLSSFKFKHRGLISIHSSPSDDRMNKRLLLEYMQSSDKKWSEIKDIQPQSNIGGLIEPPITPPKNIVGWEEVYKQIPIEVVCETAESPNSLGMTEKLIRPMLYKRPFIVIGSRWVCHSLKDNNSEMIRSLRSLDPEFSTMRFFENVIPLDYDNLVGIERVDAVFAILLELIESGRINTILDACKDDIEHNYALAKNWMRLGYI